MSSDDQFDSKNPLKFVSQAADVVIQELNSWKEEAVRCARGVAYYQGLLDEIGRQLGAEAYVSDDGSVQDSVIRAKLPELVKSLAYDAEEAKRNYKGACKTIAEMWTAATGKEGEGPQVGVIQDVRQVRLDRDRFEAASKECLRKYDQKVTEFFKVSDEKNHAYWERNQLVVALSKLFPASLERHSGAGWDDDWRWLVMIVFPTGQGSWHIHDSELEFFNHLPRQKMIAWDGHTTAEKYLRLQMLEPKT